MAFRKHRGKTKTMYFFADTAEEIRQGSLVSLTDSATLVPARNDSTDAIIGVAKSNDTLTDSGYIGVDVPVEMAVEWVVDVDSDGGAADSDVGNYIAVDTAGGGSVDAGDSNAMRVDVSDTTAPVVFVTGIVSATQVVGTLARTAWSRTFDTLDTSG